MFGISARRNTHYRETMRELQPRATEISALRLAGYYRGLSLLLPFAPAARGIRSRPRDW
jgi:hypothetical protein